VWSEATFGIPDLKAKDPKKYIPCLCRMNRSDEPSEEDGINGGRISELTIKVGGRITCKYVRGWVKEPEDTPTKIAIHILLEQYN